MTPTILKTLIKEAITEALAERDEQQAKESEQRTFELAERAAREFGIPPSELLRSPFASSEDEKESLEESSNE